MYLRIFAALILSGYIPCDVADAQLFPRLRGISTACDRQPITPVRSLLQRISHRHAVTCCQPPQTSTCGSGVSGVAVAVVPHAGPQPTPDAAPMAFGVGPSEASEFSVARMGDRREFRQAFSEATRQARKRGDIGFVQAGWIRVLTLLPGAMDQTQAFLADEAVAQGYAKAGAIDWEGLLDFLKQIDWDKLLALIMKLIDMFSMNFDQATYAALCMSP